jgi:hypothetical protein
MSSRVAGVSVSGCRSGRQEREERDSTLGYSTEHSVRGSTVQQCTVQDKPLQGGSQAAVGQASACRFVLKLQVQQGTVQGNWLRSR